MNIDLTPILQAVIILVSGLITYKLVPWLKARTTAQQQANINAWYRVFVMAAEQIYGANHGPEKMAYVKEQLMRKGFDVDVPTIEATVKELFNYNPFGAVEPLTEAPKAGETEGK